MFDDDEKKMMMAEKRIRAMKEEMKNGDEGAKDEVRSTMRENMEPPNYKPKKVGKGVVRKLSVAETSTGEPVPQTIMTRKIPLQKSSKEEMFDESPPTDKRKYKYENGIIKKI